MKKIVLLIGLLILSISTLIAQKEIRSFIFGHSLINHEFKINPTPSQETSVPHWIHFLAEEANHQYAVSGQYGFLPQHDNLPPIAQWGFDFVTPAWDSDNEPFSEANFNNILITPGNFIQWQGPTIDYPSENTTPVEATQTIFDWCIEQEESLQFYIYENWPDMAPYLSDGFPPNQSDWENYIEYLNGDFHHWFLEYYDEVKNAFPNVCVKMIPVGPIINNLLLNDPYNQIPITELYEDDAPHGRPSIYFLAALTTNMAMYEERPPSNYQTDDIIHPIIRNNYNDIVEIIWQELLSFEETNGNSLVFCNELVSTVENISGIDNIKISPNPSTENIKVAAPFTSFDLMVFDIYGNQKFSMDVQNSSSVILDISSFSDGCYFIRLKDKRSSNSLSSRFIKMTE